MILENKHNHFLDELISERPRPHRPQTIFAIVHQRKANLSDISLNQHGRLLSVDILHALCSQHNGIVPGTRHLRGHCDKALEIEVIRDQIVEKRVDILPEMQVIVILEAVQYLLPYAANLRNLRADRTAQEHRNRLETLIGADNLRQIARQRIHKRHPTMNGRLFVKDEAIQRRIAILSSSLYPIQLVLICEQELPYHIDAMLVLLFVLADLGGLCVLDHHIRRNEDVDAAVHGEDVEHEGIHVFPQFAAVVVLECLQNECHVIAQCVELRGGAVIETERVRQALLVDAHHFADVDDQSVD
mmetsp:Transcript_18515/g.29352  ORF Transcript_18515/g.29352 Transcript_18515/m.29352 type:complete len:301 (+) Transcript_18515:270-1172(+)